MNDNMEYNFECLGSRIGEVLLNSDIEYINHELGLINTSTIVTGVGGSNVVAQFTTKVLNTKNNIIVSALEPRDLIYTNLSGYSNVLCCSYSGNNYGVDLSFNNDLNHYLLSKEKIDNVTNLRYTLIDRERSFISLGSTLIPITVLLNYYVDNVDNYIDLTEIKYNFDITSDVYEIFSGIDTSTTSKYLESTMVESGIGIPIVHDKYDYCHGRSNLSYNYNNNAIYLYRGTELDKFFIEELKKYYKNFIVIKGIYEDSILDDYYMLIQSMYLTKYIANKKDIDLSLVDYSPMCKKIYRYRGNL